MDRQTLECLRTIVRTAKALGALVLRDEVIECLKKISQNAEQSTSPDSDSSLQQKLQ